MKIFAIMLSAGRFVYKKKNFFGIETPDGRDKTLF